MKPDDGFGGNAYSNGRGGGGAGGDGGSGSDDPPGPCGAASAGTGKGERKLEKNPKDLDDDFARKARDIEKREGPREAKKWLDELIKREGHSWSAARRAKLRAMAKVLGRSAGLLLILPELLFPEPLYAPGLPEPENSSANSSSSSCF